MAHWLELESALSATLAIWRLPSTGEKDLIHHTLAVDPFPADTGHCSCEAPNVVFVPFTDFNKLQEHLTRSVPPNKIRVLSSKFKKGGTKIYDNHLLTQKLHFTRASRRWTITTI